MRLSISNSERPRPAAADAAVPMKAIVTLLALCASFLGALEIGSRYALPRMSKVIRRETLEYRGAMAMRTGEGERNLLVLGNSLMGVGVEFDVLRASLASDWQVRRLYLDNTSYYDFYFGLRRLYAEGASFDAVAVVLTPRQLLSRHVRGDYFGYRLMRPFDVSSVARNTGLHRTPASNLFFARFSAFYGFRSEIRNEILGRLMPDLTPLMHLITRIKPQPLTDEEVYRVGLARLEAYRQLATEHGAQFILVLPPQIQPEGVEATKRAAAAARVAVVAVPQELTGPADYSDGFHLNPGGARKYTLALIPALKRALDSNGQDSSHQPALAGIGGGTASLQ